MFEESAPRSGGMGSAFALCIVYIILGISYILIYVFCAEPSGKPYMGFRPRRGGHNESLCMPYDVARQITNPDFIIRDIVHPNGFNLKVIDESHLVGGSKQRIIAQKLSDNQDIINEIVYAGPKGGYAQLAISYCCKLLGKRATIFVDAGSRDYAPLTENAKLLGGNIKYFDTRVNEKRLAYIQRKAEQYALENKHRYMVPFGLFDADSIQLYSTVFAPLKKMLDPPPKRLWIVAGSGLLFSVLGKLFPTTKLMIVQVGKKIWPEQLKDFNCELFISKVPFAMNIPEPHPPYDSLLNYDAKVWPFVLTHGQPDDVIWNTAGNPWSASRIHDVNKQAHSMLRAWSAVESRVINDSALKSFPYVHEKMDPPGAMFERMKKEIASGNWTSATISRDYGIDYPRADGLSNHFTEIPRMDCVVNVGDKISPHDLWNNRRRQISINAYKLGRGTLDNFEPNWTRGIMLMKSYRDCTTFNPFILVGAIHRYFPDRAIRILDPSMGWGDRLIGALACDVKEYVGFDPNYALHKGYDKIATMFAENTKTKFISHRFDLDTLSKQSPLEFDLAFTSPPYYNFEVYTGTEEDIKKDYATWLRDMYVPYLNDMVKSVRAGGYVVVRTNNIRNSKIADDTKRIVEAAGAPFVEDLQFVHYVTTQYGVTWKGNPSYSFVFRKP